MYELINKFETDANINLNTVGEGTKKAPTGNKSFGLSSSLYSNGTKKNEGHGSRQSHQKNGLESNGGTKFSPHRKLVNGGNAQNNQSSNAGASGSSNIMQLRPT